MMAAATVEDGGLCCCNTGVVRLQCTIRIKIGHVHSNNHHYYHDDDDDSHHRCCGHFDDSLSLRKDHHGVGCVSRTNEKRSVAQLILRSVLQVLMTFDTFAMFQLILSYSVDDVIF